MTFKLLIKSHKLFETTKNTKITEMRKSLESFKNTNHMWEPIKVHAYYIAFHIGYSSLEVSSNLIILVVCVLDVEVVSDISFSFFTLDSGVVHYSVVASLLMSME